jgi:hypothetical protein
LFFPEYSQSVNESIYGVVSYESVDTVVVKGTATEIYKLDVQGDSDKNVR